MTPPREPDFETLSAWLDGELDEARRAEVDAWLAAHPDRRADLERMRERERAAAKLPEDPPGLDLDAFSDRMWAEVDRQREHASGRGFVGGRVVRPGREGRAWTVAARALWLPVAAAAIFLVVLKTGPGTPRVSPDKGRLRDAGTPATAHDSSIPPAGPQSAAKAPSRNREAEPARAPGAAVRRQPGTTPTRQQAAEPVRALEAAPAPPPAASPPVESAQKPGAQPEAVGSRVSAARPAPAPGASVSAPPEAFPRGILEPAGKAKAETPEAPVADNVIHASPQVRDTAARSGYFAQPMSLKTGTFPRTTEGDMSYWLGSIGPRGDYRGPDPAGRSLRSPPPRDSIIATVPRWRDALRKNPDDMVARAALCWALTERALRDSLAADCDSARVEIRRALDVPGDRLRAFLENCRKRLDTGPCDRPRR